jgi:hypothetical protein
LIGEEAKEETSMKQDFLVAYLILVSCLAYFSILKMEATCSSEKSVYFQRTTRRYIPEYITLQSSQIPHDTTWDRTRPPRWEAEN